MLYYLVLNARFNLALDFDEVNENTITKSYATKLYIKTAIAIFS